ncbi:MAG: hypothetical protein GX843_01660 [Synergistaceae bacterium]|nr:hypothetical protein [Synergistaceae bacterium]
MPRDGALSRGERFSAVFCMMTPGFEEPVPVESRIAEFSKKARASPGQSYKSTDVSAWADPK